MDRVYDSGVSATPTVVPVAPETGYPIAGDPLTATPATKPGAYWFYMMTESLRRLIVAAGLTPDHEDLDLVTDAVDAKITAAIAPAASETVAGKAELATQAEALAGTDDARIMTPLKVTKLFSDTGCQSLAASGYQKLPGGLVIQWGSIALGASGTNAVTYPVSFPTATLSVVGQVLNNAYVGLEEVEITGITSAAFNAYIINGAGTYSAATINWIAFGY